MTPRGKRKAAAEVERMLHRAVNAAHLVVMFTTFKGHGAKADLRESAEAVIRDCEHSAQAMRRILGVKP